MNLKNEIRVEYSRLRKLGQRGSEALRAARINVDFRNSNLVRLEDVWDEDVYDDSYVDTWGLSEDRAKRIKAELQDRVVDEGTWGLVALVQCRLCDEWREVDSTWGFIGDDWIDSGYDVDLKNSALEESWRKGDPKCQPVKS